MSRQDPHEPDFPGLRYIPGSAIDNRALSNDRDLYSHPQPAADSNTFYSAPSSGFPGYTTPSATHSMRSTVGAVENEHPPFDWSRSIRQNGPTPPFSQQALSSGPPPSTAPPNHERDFRQFHSAIQQAPSHQAKSSTLWWGDLEPWMDEEYAKQVCKMLGWEPVSVKVPHVVPDGSQGPQANNPGYCFLTFPSPAQAASVLSSVRGSSSTISTMPNSTKSFNLNWAASVPISPFPYSPQPPSLPLNQPQVPHSAPAQPAQAYTKEYSIFVGDLAPETSNSDLVAVFRNPVLGLRNDREPKFIRPFNSCKSAKIMLDPVTGVSRGYGFVRFTDEADQQRALIEMHGLYCLSRPMRISPATAKFKSSQSLGEPSIPPPSHMDQQQYGFPYQPQPKSVSAPIAGASPPFASLVGMQSSASGSSVPTPSSSSNSFQSNATSNTSASSVPQYNFPQDDIVNLPNNLLAQIAQQYAAGSAAQKPAAPVTSITAQYAQELSRGSGNPATDMATPRYMISEESWKHHAQARAILGNLIGPNGEQLTSTDPYNTTVFVGGLSPLISEETLRTFFAPFGDIHYVKVPVGKHCGFVQFVRKADAERAIEKMQGFPIGGSRIRLSWGRSQYKAAQAAAQAAQSAALQNHFNSTTLSIPSNAPPPPPPPPAPASAPTSALTPEQLVQIIQTMAAQGIIDPQTLLRPTSGTAPHQASFHNDDKHRGAMLGYREEGPLPFETYITTSGRSPIYFPELSSLQLSSSFSPFSPDPNVAFETADNSRRDPISTLPHPHAGYPYMSSSAQPGPSVQARARSPQDVQAVTTNNGQRVSPSHGRPPSTPRYGPFLDGSLSAYPVNKAPGRPEGSISRPSSGQPSLDHSSDSDGQDHDTIQDLNGTLASLDLTEGTPNRNHWKTPEDRSEDSVQFNLAPRKVSSP